jgi:O-antigen biosynthesis protein
MKPARSARAASARTETAALDDTEPVARRVVETAGGWREASTDSSKKPLRMEREAARRAARATVGRAAEGEAPTKLSAANAGRAAGLVFVPATPAPGLPEWVDRRDHAAPAAPALQAYIDEASCNRITGWIWDPTQPEDRISLDLLEGDRLLARARADEYRSDLRQAGIGDGRHAFTIPLGEALLPSARHVLKLRCTDTGTELPVSPLIVERHMPPIEQESHELPSPYLPVSAIDAPVADRVDPTADMNAAGDAPKPVAVDNDDRSGSATPRPEGEASPARDTETVLQSNIDFAGLTGIRGWVWDPQEPQKRIVLDLLDGEMRLATVLANEFREDLEEAGLGDGRHGFSIAFSETLLPHARHVLRLRPVGSNVDLPSFPLVLTRDAVGVDPTVTQFIRSNVMAEADRATKTDDLAPIIAAMVGFLDAALSRYFAISEEGAASAANLLGPAELSLHVRTLVDSMRANYPPIVVAADAEPLISIIIPVFNKFELTYNCVKSIAEHDAQTPFEIIIVDDCSRDETMFARFAFGPEIRVIRNVENGGFIHSCNRGFEAARGEYAVFLNNDTEVKPRWLDELYETMQRDPAIGVAGAKLLGADGRLQECGGIIWRLGDGWNWGRDQTADDPRFCYMRDADYVSGAALMIRSGLFKELGGFDEHYLPMYYEDTDLCFRARARGHRVVVQPAAEVVHLEGATGGTSVTGPGMKRFQAINHRKFFERWKDVLASHRFNGEMPELEAERAVCRRALFIDDSVPEPDKDAGSNAAVEHMLSLQRLGMKVTFIPADNMARIEPYTTALQRRGIECLYHPYYFSVEDVFRKNPIPFDLVYLHRYSNAAKYAGMIRQHFPKTRILYSVADLHFLRLQRQAEVQDDAELREQAEQLRRLEISAMSFVDCVIVHSAAEAALLRELAPDIEVAVIPWTIPTRDLDKTEAKRPAIAFIGGYRHPPNVDAAKWAAQSIMPLLRKRIPGIELLLVGSHMPTELTALAAPDIVPLGYVPSIDGVFERVRLTVAPLRYGAGLKGKVLESLASGIPCVMTSVAAEGIDLPSELEMLVADDPELLSQRIAMLCHDEPQYRRVAEAGKAHVLANYSAERVDALIRQASRIG